MPPIMTPTYAKEFQKVIETAAKGRQIFTVQVNLFLLYRHSVHKIVIVKHFGNLIYGYHCSSSNLKEQVLDSVLLGYGVRIEGNWEYFCKRSNRMGLLEGKRN